MPRRRLIHQGETKSLYEGDLGDTYVLHFRDDPTSDQANCHAPLEGKGVLNNRISECMMSRLGKFGIATHFMQALNMREQLIRSADVLPFKIRISNFACEKMRKRLGLGNNEILPRPLIEFYLKDESLDFPLITEDQLTAFGWASHRDLDEILPLAARTNDFLAGMLSAIGFTLAELTLEVGRIWEDDLCKMVVIDELSPDVFELWDDKSQARFRFGSPINDEAKHNKVQTELAKRLGILTEISRPLLKPRLTN